MINAILIANPKGAQSKDEDGRLPLHYACLKGASQGVETQELSDRIDEMRAEEVASLDVNAEAAAFGI